MDSSYLSNLNSNLLNSFAMNGINPNSSNFVCQIESHQSSNGVVSSRTRCLTVANENFHDAMEWVFQKESRVTSSHHNQSRRQYAPVERKIIQRRSLPQRQRLERRAFPYPTPRVPRAPRPNQTLNGSYNLRGLFKDPNQVNQPLDETLNLPGLYQSPTPPPPRVNPSPPQGPYDLRGLYRTPKPNESLNESLNLPGLYQPRAKNTQNEPYDLRGLYQTPNLNESLNESLNISGLFNDSLNQSGIENFNVDQNNNDGTVTISFRLNPPDATSGSPKILTPIVSPPPAGRARLPVKGKVLFTPSPSSGPQRKENIGDMKRNLEGQLKVAQHFVERTYNTLLQHKNSNSSESTIRNAASTHERAKKQVEAIQKEIENLHRRYGKFRSETKIDHEEAYNAYMNFYKNFKNRLTDPTIKKQLDELKAKLEIAKQNQERLFGYEDPALLTPKAARKNELRRKYEDASRELQRFESQNYAKLRFHRDPQLVKKLQELQDKTLRAHKLMTRYG